MEEENKLPLKRVELSLTKFNEVAIPHHLDLLRQHKANILKVTLVISWKPLSSSLSQYEQCGQFARVRSEQTHARRVAAQLRALLAELEALRRRVRASDRARFDRRTARARDLTLRAVVDYLGVIERSCIALVTHAQARPRPSDSSPVSIPGEPAECALAPGSAASSESVGLVAPPDAELIQLQVDETELQLRAREAALRGWAELQAELRALHAAWQHAQAAALASRDQVSAAADDVEVAADNVRAARTTLAAAERLRAGAYGACGALGGALLGGPAGLLLGAKAGLAVGLAAGGLGYLGGAGLARALPAPDQDRPLAGDTRTAGGALLGGPAGLLLGAKAGLAVGLAAGGLGYLGGAGLARALPAPDQDRPLAGDTRTAGGALLGGPAGLLLGAKAGLAVGLAAGGLGYLGGAGLARALPAPDQDRPLAGDTRTAGGALLGGPAGLLLGAKAGLAVGLAAGGLGYLGGAGLARALPAPDQDRPLAGDTRTAGGALLGGPAGLLLGAKAGLAVGLAAGGLGYLGGAGLARALPAPDQDRPLAGDTRTAGGALLGGPAGLLLGAKAGLAVGLAAGGLGYLGGAGLARALPAPDQDRGAGRGAGGGRAGLPGRRGAGARAAGARPGPLAGDTRTAGGALLGGPAGLLLGAKAGLAVGLAAGGLGYLGGAGLARALPAPDQDRPLAGDTRTAGGALLGGPAGLLLGAKAGLAVGLAAGGLGYLGGAGLARALPAPDQDRPLAGDTRTAGGALLGGPAGLLLGAKAGLAVGLAAGGLGYLGGAGLARALPAPDQDRPLAGDTRTAGGALLGGPAGLLLGAKAGLAVGLAAGGLGYLGGAGLARALPAPDQDR
ncbi:PE-PGRS family protein PE_PGRS33 [Pararge aegeria]|uniref:PE-PGRS family protein PE_PGRS33 n=1 Tax=Pararge aegeria TaxID=116150 RepID=UPI0019D007D7|nr:PE-PGRS family protein PE_PGRS33 [Pararge aegeria]